MKKYKFDLEGLTDEQKLDLHRQRWLGKEVAPHWNWFWTGVAIILGVTSGIILYAIWELST